MEKRKTCLELLDYIRFISYKYFILPYFKNYDDVESAIGRGIMAINIKEELKKLRKEILDVNLENLYFVHRIDIISINPISYVIPEKMVEVGINNNNNYKAVGIEKETIKKEDFLKIYFKDINYALFGRRKYNINSEFINDPIFEEWYKTGWWKSPFEDDDGFFF